MSATTTQRASFGLRGVRRWQRSGRSPYSHRAPGLIFLGRSGCAVERHRGVGTVAQVVGGGWNLPMYAAIFFG